MRTSRLHLILGLLLLLGLVRAPAQTPAYLHYTVRDGLPGNLVYCSLQDRRGLIWFGTDKGLACFDGLRFRTYGIADGLPDAEVLALKEDSRGRLWVFCFQEEPCYLENGRVVRAAELPFWPKTYFSNGTSSMWEDRKGGVWFIEQSNLYYHGPAGSFFYYSPYTVASVQQLGADVLILANKAVMRLTPERNIVPIFPLETEHGVPFVRVSKRHILYSFSDRLVLLAYEDGQVRELATQPQPTGQVFTDRSGRFWVCSVSEGAICFDNDRQDLTNPVRYLPDKKLTSVMEDNQGTLWFTSIDEGVYALPRYSPLIYGRADFPSPNIRSLAWNPAGQLLAGDNVGNVHILEGDRRSTVALGAPKGYNQVRQIIPDGPGAFWAATDDDLYRCTDEYGRTAGFGQIYRLKGMAIQDGSVWLASSTRLGRLSFDPYRDAAVAIRRSTALTVDAGNNLWAGGINGLYSQRDSFQFNWGECFPELRSRITALQPAGPDRLWVATARHGLVLVTVRAGAVTAVDVINKRLKYPIHTIQSLFAEPDGTIWMATNRGVYGLDRHDRVLHLDVHDGLADDDVNAVLVQGDTLWAGTVSGLTRIMLHPPDPGGDFPTYVTALRYQRNDRVTSLRLLDSAGSRRELLLEPDISNVELELAGPDFRSRGNLGFEIVQSRQLLPVRWWTVDHLIAWFSDRSPDTIRTETGTLSLGTHLPVGRYRMEVTAITADRTRSRCPDTWTLLKLPHWYESIWFFGLMWLVGGYAAWRTYRVRLAYRDVRATASMLQLQTFQAQINPHFIGNSINAIQQFLHPPDPVKTSEYIALFTRLLRRAMHYSEQPVISFGEELAYDREYLQLTQLRFENRFFFQITGTEEVPAETPIPSMLLQPFLENATLHGIAPEGPSCLHLHFTFDAGRVVCELTDNGLGFRKVQRQKFLSGMERQSKGLLLVQKKVESLNILYKIDLTLSMEDLSESVPPGRGTRVVFSYNSDRLWNTIKKSPTSSAAFPP